MSLFFMGPVVVPSPQAGPRAPLPCFLSPARCHIMPPTSVGHVSCRSPAPPFSLYMGAPGRTTPPPRFLRREATHQIPICKPSELNAPFFLPFNPIASFPTVCPRGPQVGRRRPPGTPSPCRIWVGALLSSASSGELHALMHFIVDWSSPHPPISSPVS
jgi:hypothetical protein